MFNLGNACRFIKKSENFEFLVKTRIFFLIQNNYDPKHLVGILTGLKSNTILQHNMSLYYFANVNFYLDNKREMPGTLYCFSCENLGEDVQIEDVFSDKITFQLEMCSQEKNIYGIHMAGSWKIGFSKL